MERSWADGEVLAGGTLWLGRQRPGVVSTLQGLAGSAVILDTRTNGRETTRRQANKLIGYVMICQVCQAGMQTNTHTDKEVTETPQAGVPEWRLWHFEVMHC